MSIDCTLHLKILKSILHHNNINCENTQQKEDLKFIKGSNYLLDDPLFELTLSIAKASNTSKSHFLTETTLFLVPISLSTVG